MPALRDNRTGRWIFRKMVKLPDGTKRRIFGTAIAWGQPNTRAGAEEAERLAIAQIRESGSPDPTPTTPAPAAAAKEVPTLEQYANDTWLKVADTENKKSTRVAKRQMLRKVLPFMGKLPLDKIDKLAIDRWRTALVEGGLQPNSANTHLMYFRSLMNSAASHGLITAAPKVKLLKFPKPEIDFLTFEEVNRLLSTPLPIMARTMILTGLRTGMRIGELRALRWSDIDWTGGRLTVQRNLVHGELVSPKSNRSREIPLSTELLRALDAYKRERTAMIVFSSADGGSLPEQAAYKLLSDATSAAGLRSIGWHTLRHTFASHLVMRGVSLKVVQELLGHSDMLQTLRYSHLTPAIRRDAVDLLDQPAPVGVGERVDERRNERRERRAL